MEKTAFALLELPSGLCVWKEYSDSRGGGMERGVVSKLSFGAQ